MLVRFFNHGRVRKGALTRTGGGGAVRNYLLVASEDKTKPREGARLIYGNEVETTEVINGIKNNKIYTSGVLSFAPEESITDAQKIEIIESFEQNLFPGLMPGEYSGYWVEHKDKDRQELHFVFAEIHLPSGKALPVYY
ncbi:relaxase/mobilization nuclease domain-containing protein, partial [Campylobacter lari]